MTIYFQHVGQKNADRDFPKTLGDSSSGLKLFGMEDLREHIEDMPPSDIVLMNDHVAKCCPNGFQIWGIPSGAKSVLRELEQGDLLLLLEGATDSGKIGYAGRIVYRVPGHQSQLSRRLWGEDRFPLIVLLDGALIDYPWPQFKYDFRYKDNWRPAGQTYRITDERFLDSQFNDEQAVVNYLLGDRYSLSGGKTFRDLGFNEPEGVSFSAAEGKTTLKLHIEAERSSSLIQKFKSKLESFDCKICGFDFETAYGDLGRGYIEAHHLKPVSDMKPGDVTSVEDLVAVCSNCHRMLHRAYPSLTVSELKERIRFQYSLRS